MNTLVASRGRLDLFIPSY